MPARPAADLLLSVLSAEEQMLAHHLLPIPEHSASTPVLARFGVQYRPALAAAPALDCPRETAPPQRWWLWRSQRDPKWTVEAARIAETARKLSAGDATSGGLRHLLRATLADQDEAARALISRLDADPSAIVAST